MLWQFEITIDVAEAMVLKNSEVSASQGSNPCLSANVVPSDFGTVARKFVSKTTQWKQTQYTYLHASEDPENTMNRFPDDPVIDGGRRLSYPWIDSDDSRLNSCTSTLLSSRLLHRGVRLHGASIQTFTMARYQIEQAT